MKMLRLKSLFFTACFFLSVMTPLHAAELWSMNSASLLYGTNFAVPYSSSSDDKSRFVLTLEHGSKNSWGDVFGFLDTERSTQTQQNGMYGEITPRFSLFTFRGYEAKPDAIISDVLTAITLEAGVNPSGFNFVNILWGPGLSLKLPYFQYFNLNFSRRLNQRSPSSWQISPAFGLPFSVGRFNFRIDGFIDAVTSTSQLSSHIHSQTQVKWDFGKVLLNKAETIYLGTEYRYWKNKFGVEGVTESVWQALLQVRF